MDKISFSNFALSNDILKALNKLGYNNPSPVQNKTIPFILKNKDVIVKSQTGSGKTGAFGIPLCEKIKIEEVKPQALILTPTRELAIQVKEEISNIGRLKRIRCAAVFGKQPMEIQKRELKQRVHMVVGTPGRVLDHIERGTLNLEKIKYFIIDEADEMLNMGFISQVESIINMLPKNRVTMLFSATMPKEIEDLCNKYMINPQSININPESITVEKIEQSCYIIEENEKFDTLNKIICTENPHRCIIFCNTRDKVCEVVKNMQQEKYCCRALHGGMEQSDRLDVMKSYKNGEIRFLVATDVASRGIHVEDLTHVVNYDIPVEKESYVHRIGRTGRAGSRGVAITFVPFKHTKLLNDIEEYINYKIPIKQVPTEEEVNKAKNALKNKVKIKPQVKINRTNELEKDITKIYISAGKKKKIRPGDIVGAITNIEGINAEDIGIIDVQDGFSYVDILGKKGSIVLKASKNLKIKGKSVKLEKAIK